MATDATAELSWSQVVRGGGTGWEVAEVSTRGCQDHVREEVNDR